MKSIIKLVGDYLTKMDINKFYALLLFVALMFAIFVLWQRDNRRWETQPTTRHNEKDRGAKLHTLPEGDIIPALSQDRILPTLRFRK